MKGIVQKEAFVARKKQHLRYQAKKGRLQTAAQSEVTREETPKTASSSKASQEPDKLSKRQPQEFTKLPDSETQFVRKEIVYIGFITLVLAILYIIIFLLFRFTGVDEWLSGLIRLSN